MKYKNTSNKPIHLHFDEWVTIKPGQVYDIPANVAEKEPGLCVYEEPKTPVVPKKSAEAKAVFPNPEVGWKKFSKDGLNDYAARIGLGKEINTDMDRKDMVNRIANYIEAQNVNEK